MKNDLGGGLRGAQAPMACYGCAVVNWAVIPFHLLILGTSKYLENDGAPKHRTLAWHNFTPGLETLSSVHGADRLTVERLCPWCGWRTFGQAHTSPGKLSWPWLKTVILTRPNPTKLQA